LTEINSRGARAVGVKDLDGEELGLLGNTIGGTADGAGNVSTVAITISVAAVPGVVGEPGSAATKVLAKVSVRFPKFKT
jgi:hypothetical protein